MRTLFDELEDNIFIEDSKYTKNINGLTYIPKGEKPNILSLCDNSKYNRLIGRIKNSNINEEDKKFLYLAATRHLVFNYQLIADYYANSDKEVQELMEQSALVIIDFNKALENGYIKMSNKLINEYNNY